MRKLVITVVLALAGASYAGAQEVLSLQQAIAAAKGESYEAEAAEAYYQAEVWNYESFRSGLKPHLELNLNPNYIKESYDYKYQYAYPRNFNMFSTTAELKLKQKVSSLGGDFYASSSGVWTKYFNNVNDYQRLFGTAPIRIGYQQDLLGFNRYKWEKAIHEAEIDKASVERNNEMLAIAGKTAGLYMDALRAEELYKMYKGNSETAESLFKIGQEKFKITAIRNDELSSLELQWQNSINSCAIAEIEMKNAFAALESYLQLGGSIAGRLAVPEMPGSILIDRDAVMNAMETNNPVYSRNKLSMLEARRDEEKAKKETGIQADMDLNMGLQNYSPAFGAAFTDQNLFSYSGVGIRIPIINQKTAKDRYKAAQYATRAADARANEDLRSLRVEVESAIRDFENYQTLIGQAEKTMKLADEAYRQANDNYASGIADINTFAIAQSRKESAYSNYLNALCNYWEAYYRLAVLCGKELTELYPL